MIKLQDIETLEALRDSDEITWSTIFQTINAFKKSFPKANDFILEINENSEEELFFKLDLLTDLPEEEIKVRLHQVYKWWNELPEDVQNEIEIGASRGLR